MGDVVRRLMSGLAVVATVATLFVATGPVARSW
jgi:hypothetical protein